MKTLKDEEIKKIKFALTLARSDLHRLADTLSKANLSVVLEALDIIERIEK